MALEFTVLPLRAKPNVGKKNHVELIPGDWDDYFFKTSFQVYIFDPHGSRYDLGTVKIGRKGQGRGWTVEQLPKSFNALSSEWFSLGQDVSYYQLISTKLDSQLQQEFLRGLGDVVFNSKIYAEIQDLEVVTSSLMRTVSVSVIVGQFARVLSGDVSLTDFHFVYKDPGDTRHARVELSFKVGAASTPPTNIHVLIGPNGIGKTTLLHEMVGSILRRPASKVGRGRFFVRPWNGAEESLPLDYFSSVVSVSFSAFDSFIPPSDQPDLSVGTRYFYIGMKKSRLDTVGDTSLRTKSAPDFTQDFIYSLKSCLSQPAKRARWLKAIRRLESDANFASMSLPALADLDLEDAVKAATDISQRMSSGHSIVLLTVTKLVDTVEEKTLVLMDEPESHLHPPLLSAFMRSLADLLQNRNGVAIVATHSPVVVQEVPMSCVWIINRAGTEGRADRPERETFGENVGVLTREIFGLEVQKSGFHAMLRQAVDEGGSLEDISKRYMGQLGFEAQGILLSLIAARDSTNGG